MNSKFTLTKRKKLILTTVIICAVLIAGLAILRQGGPVTQAAIVQPQPGLVGWWQFNEGTGAVANDSSGNGNNGTIYGATWVTTGNFGNALSFNGVNNYVSIPDSASLRPSNLTIAFWVYLLSYPSGSPMIVGKGTTYGVKGYGISISPGGYIDFRICNSAGSEVDVFSTNALSLDTWYFIAGTFDGSTMRLYVNGVQNNNASQTGIGDTTGINVYVAYNWVDGTYLNAIIDQVQIYNRALSAAEIQGYYQSPGFSTNLLAEVPQGTTDFIATLSWQGTGSINVTVQTPFGTYAESNSSVYQKTTYSVSGGISAMLNIKRLEVSGFSALSSAQNWYIVLATSNVQNYQISVEVQS